MLHKEPYVKLWRLYCYSRKANSLMYSKMFQRTPLADPQANNQQDRSNKAWATIFWFQMPSNVQMRQQRAALKWLELG